MNKLFLLASATVAVVAGATLLVGNDEAAPADDLSNLNPQVAPDTNAPPAPVTPEPIPQAKILTAPPLLSPGVQEVVDLARARVGDEVMLAYIEASTNLFQLSADEIIYLRDVGVSTNVVSAMVRHRQELQEKNLLPAAPSAQTAISSPAPPSEPPAAPPPAVSSAPPAEPAAETPPPATDAAAVAESPAVVEAPANATPPVTYNYFYNTLSPYGNWVQVDGYGWCWQPTVGVVQASWQPYCDDGRWVYTDCGWYWNSYYSWGWAPFHYGRWYHHHRHGWVWYPGNVWGPAWVTWRYYDGYCGWAPLPPACGYVSGVGLTYHGSRVSVGFGFGLSWSAYTYVPTSHFYGADPWRYRVHGEHGVQIHNHSTVINNYVVGNHNTTIINVGPGTRVIAGASRTEIRKVALHDVNATDSTIIRADQLSRDGRTLAVYRPRLPQPAATPPADVLRHQQQIGRQSDALAKSPAVQRAADRVRAEGLTKPLRLGDEAMNSPRPSTAAEAPA